MCAAYALIFTSKQKSTFGAQLSSSSLQFCPFLLASGYILLANKKLHRSSFANVLFIASSPVPIKSHGFLVVITLGNKPTASLDAPARTARPDRFELQQLIAFR